MKLTYTEKFLIVIICLIVIKLVFSRYDFSSLNISLLNSPKSKKISTDLGMTFEEFRLNYELNVAQKDMMISLANARQDTKGIFEKKLQENRQPLFSLGNADFTDRPNFCDYKFHCADVVMRICKDVETGNINQIIVIAKPFITPTNAEKVFTLFTQMSVFSLATMVFYPNMSDPDYREDMIKRFYSNPDVNYLLGENLRCKSVRIGDYVVLVARHKDFHDKENILDDYFEHKK